MVQQRDDNLVIRIYGTFYSSDDINFNTSVEIKDMTVDGSLTIEGNLTTRCLWINKGGYMDINGNVKSHGNIQVDDNIIIDGDCDCLKITTNGFVCISGNCSCGSIKAGSDVIIDGSFSGNINNIKVPEGHHVYIGGNRVK